MLDVQKFVVVESCAFTLERKAFRWMSVGDWNPPWRIPGPRLAQIVPQVAS